MGQEHSEQIKRILSIDGGGIKGVMPAAYLTNIEETLGIKVSDYFDLIVGTSTGGIIALALGIGKRPQAILNLYKEKGATVFGQDVTVGLGLINRTYLSVKQCFLRKYSSNNLKEALSEVFGNERLGDSKNRLVIPAYSDSRAGPYIFKTAHNERFRNDYKTSAVDIAMATSAAPAYFPKYQIKTGEELVDGGVWANNPTGVAALEAACVLGWKMDKLHILSLGCTSNITTYPRHGGLISLISDRKIVKLLLDGQAHTSMATAKLLLGGPESVGRIIREEVLLEKDYYQMDDTSKVNILEGLANEQVRHRLPKIEKTFFSSKVEPFIPIHKEKPNARQ